MLKIMYYQFGFACKTCVVALYNVQWPFPQGENTFNRLKSLINVGLLAQVYPFKEMVVTAPTEFWGMADAWI